MWQTESIGRRSASVYQHEPTRAVVVYLADTETNDLPENDHLTSLLRQHQISCVSPDAGLTYWPARLDPSFDPDITPEDYLVKELLPWIRSKWGDRSLGIVGTNAGGQAALRLAFKYPKLFRSVAALDAELDHYLIYGQGTSIDAVYATQEQCRQDSAALHIHPTQWPSTIWFACQSNSPWLRGNDRLHEKLMALGVPHTIDFETLAEGFTSSLYSSLVSTMIQVVVQGMERESRRLL